VLGGLPKTAGIQLPQRHLGLQTAEDEDMSSNYIQQLADLVEQHINLDAVLESAAVCEPLNSSELSEDTTLCRSPTSPPSPLGGKHVRIGIARDEVFCFYYQANLNLLEGTS
jgi:cobyrinic acid a,c-diamide synthase